MNCPNVNNSYNQTFSSRCVQIRDAQWVCHVINTTIPYSSTTRYKPMFEKQFRKVVGTIIPDKSPMDIVTLYEYLKAMHLTPEERKNFNNIFKRIMRTIFYPRLKYTQKDLNILASIREMITDFGEKRHNCIIEAGDNTILSSLKMLDKLKLGNCYETAMIAELVLKMNGVKNAKTVFLKNAQGVEEHAVCVFNRDGSKFKKFENNKTIIVDPWAGKADFSVNMFKYYENMLSDNFIINTKKPANYIAKEYVKLSSFDFIHIKKYYPSFKYKSARKFMEK